ncbi:MATE family efflux transporter [Pseudohalocynthiibacter aestuariivivens]|jgi:MATE family, multidrug efflux pump|uniref:MATE family efflux transporter n=1 Tax=Pseudohalocynthiibacter aestuariivivens TaxID=1591409 RepID=A0ABV5JD88_9RHOB|nr:MULTISPECIES: MATE family efflux transporter [Pseudohalocynthiibacter]MBS9717092.1 MATE family efflux transporter [Pseudohalocynthiibacter aestuariivivens]MCK0103984.1 MATE family efflux transporter [Pseudohalocynthiibacter sp. F2068]
MAETVHLTHRRVLNIALPIVLSNATVPILGAVDTGVVGQIGLAAPIGAVGIGAIILTALYWIFGFLRMGTVGLTGQALGSGDSDEVQAMLSRALMIGGAAGFCVILMQLPLFWAAFHLSPASAEVEGMARSYMRIRVYSAPAAIALYGITGWLIAQERTRGVLVLQLWMNLLNIVLDLWFVLGLDWGVEGVAFATFLAEWSGLGLGLWLCRDGFAGDAWRRFDNVFNTRRLKRMLLVNIDILIRSLLLQAMFVSFLFLGSDFGDVELAANQILLQFLEITAYALDGFAFAAEALVGQALGARNRLRLRRAALISSFWSAIWVVLLTLAFMLYGGKIIDIMTTAPEVREAARTYLGYMIAAPALGIAAWMFDGIFIGATRTKDMRNMMAISAVVYLISLAVLLPTFGNHGLWISLLISFVARGVTLALRYPALEQEAA